MTQTTIDSNGAAHDGTSGQFTGQRLNEGDPVAILGHGSRPDGTTWFQNPDLSVEYRDAQGNLHREDGPALSYPDGTNFWFRHGTIHRADGPAIERADGTREWLIDGELHNDNGPAMIIKATGQRIFYRRGVIHREDGPAIEWPDGTGAYFFDCIYCPDQAAFDEMRGSGQ